MIDFPQKIDWHGCYSDSWKGEATPESHAHPAKFSRSLIRQIYQWARLCVAVGLKPLVRVRAWLVEDRGSQYGLNGQLVTKTVQRKSFFRRLAEKNGSPRIDWEDVLIFVK